MALDRRLLGEDDFFDPRDLGFMTPPAAPAVVAPAAPAAPAAPRGVLFAGTPEYEALRHYNPDTEVYTDPYAGIMGASTLATAASKLGFQGETLYDPGMQTFQGGLENYAPSYSLTPEYGQFLQEKGYRLGTYDAPPGSNGQYTALFDAQGNKVAGTEQFHSFTDRDFGIGTALLTAAAGNIAPLGFGVLNTASALQQGNIGAAALNLARLAGVPGVGDVTKTIGQTAAKAIQDLLPEELFGTTVGDVLTKTAQDAAQQAAFSAITGKEIDLGSAITSSLIDQGLGGIAKEIGISPKTLTAGLKLAAGQGGVSDIYNLVSGGLGKISDISKEGLAPQQEVDRLLARYPAPAIDTGDELARLEARYPSITPLELEFLPPTGAPVSLPDEFISTLAPEETQTFPVDTRDVRSLGPIDITGRRDEDLDMPLDIYLPELFGGPPPRAGEHQGPSEIEVTGKRPEDVTPIPPFLDVDAILREPAVEVPPVPEIMPTDQQVEIVGKRDENVTPIPSSLIDEILREGVPDEKPPSQIADEILGEKQQIEITGKRPSESVTPIPPFLDIDEILREPLPDMKTPEQLAEEILPSPPPVAPSPPPRAPSPAPATRPGELDLSALFALLGMMGARPEKEDPYQTANVAPGVEAGLRAIEQMYGTRRG